MAQSGGTLRAAPATVLPYRVCQRTKGIALSRAERAANIENRYSQKVAAREISANRDRAVSLFVQNAEQGASIPCFLSKLIPQWGLKFQQKQHFFQFGFA